MQKSALRGKQSKKSRLNKRKEPSRRQRYQAKNDMIAPPKTMSIVLFLGKNVKEYNKNSKEIIQGFVSSGALRCKLCLRPMTRHSSYERRIKEAGQKITITIVWCSKCKKWHALLPDFLLPQKHYGGDEIESVIIDSASVPVNQIETEASEVTVRRWISGIGERITRAVSILKHLFKGAGQSVSEAAIDPGAVYSELEQILEMAPKGVKYSGNKLGLANLWLGTNDIPAYI
jgi:hypothetical protein